jgi:UDP-glucose 4-epimerase
MSHVQHVLITGGCGFIGANLVRLLRDRTDWSLRVVDDMRTGRPETVEGMAEVHDGDVGDPAVLDEVLEGVDAVVHLASETGVAPSVENPVRDFQGNAMTTFRVLEGCRNKGVRRFVFASSGAAVGDVTPPIHENIVARPLSPYGAGKLVGEAYCQAYAGSFGLDTIALRFSNVYGPLSAHKMKNAVPSFITLALRGEDLHIYGDGTQTRDFIYVDDLCEGIFNSVTTEGVAGEVFQLGTAVETSILEIAEIVRDVVGTDVDIHFEPRRAGEVYKSRVDISKATRLLDFNPTIDVKEGLARTAEWYRGLAASGSGPTEAV